MDRQGSTAGLAPVANVPPCCRFLGVRKRSTIEGKPTLWGALKRKELDTELPSEPAPQSLPPIAESALRPASVTPDCDSPRCASNPSPKRRRKPAPVGSLYPQPEPEPLTHARALLQQIQMYAEDAIGTYIPQSQLERFYGELCEREGWTPRSWTAIGRRLKELTDRRRLKRNGKQFQAYRIPRARSE